jgi:hypothetical protein
MAAVVSPDLRAERVHARSCEPRPVPMINRVCETSFGRFSTAS